MATERIDVLAVMDSAANELDREGCQEPNENGDSLMVARAAVAELIDAAAQVYGSDNMTADWPRLGAALDRVGGV